MASAQKRVRPDYANFRDSLEDFWQRQRLQPTHRLDLRIFGRPLRVDSNHPSVLEAVELAARAYSVAEASEPGYSMQIVVDDRLATGIDPVGHLPGDIHYAGSQDWLSMGLGPWGRAHIDLSAGEAVLIVAPALAASAPLLARWVIHTIWTNFLIRSGYGMLHATALHRDGTLLCIVGPHNAGKSTTALQLALRGGWELLSDSLVFIDGSKGALRFNAFPVGRVSLRRDALDDWPELEDPAERQPIRNEHKYDIDLAAVAPNSVRFDAVCPERVLLFLIDRDDSPRTVLAEVPPHTVAETLVSNSMFVDAESVWSENLLWLDLLMSTAEAHRIVVGRDVVGLLETIERLMPGQTD